MPSPLRRAVLAVAALCLTLPAAAPAATRDFAATALNIVPSGQFGAVPRRPARTARRACTTR